MELLVTIGVDADVAERLRGALDARVVADPAVPRLHSLEGAVRVESASVHGRGPLALVAKRRVATKGDALRLEAAVKRERASEKLARLRKR